MKYLNKILIFIFWGLQLSAVENIVGLQNNHENSVVSSNNIVEKQEEFIDIYSKPAEVSSEWKSDMSETFYKDIAIIKQVVLDGEKDQGARDKFLKSFRDQQDWFDAAMSTTQEIGDNSYKEIEDKKFFVSRIADAQRRSDILLNDFAKNFKVDSFIKKKIRLDILADINTYVLEEIRRSLKSTQELFLSEKAINNIFNQNINDFKQKTIISSGSINPELLNGINLSIGKLITKDDYQNFSTKLRENISSELKEIFSTIDKKIQDQVSKNNEESKKNYQDLLNSLDTKLSSTEARLQVYIDRKMQDFERKIDSLASKQAEKSGIIDLELVENKIKTYFDEKLGGIESKIDTAQAVTAPIIEENKKVQSIFDISKKNIDKKIYDEVGRQLSALKEDRIKKFEKLSRKKKKDERRKLLRDLLEKELNNKEVS